MHLEAMTEPDCRSYWTWSMVGSQWEVHRVLGLNSLVSEFTTVGIRWGNITFEPSWRTAWWRSILEESMLETTATSRDQLIILTMDRRRTLMGGCYTWCMLYLVLTHDHGMEREMDNLPLCSTIMVVLRTTMREGEWWWERDGGYRWIWEISGIIGWLGLEDHI